MDTDPPSAAPAFSLAPEAYDPDYADLLKTLQVVSVRFAKAHVTAPSIYIANPARRLRSSTTRGGRYLNFASGFAATLEFQFRGWWEDEPETGVAVEAEVEILYRSQLPMTDAIFRAFKDRSLAVHAWPYLREFVQSSLGRAGWPAATLPSFPRAR